MTESGSDILAMEWRDREASADEAMTEPPSKYREKQLQWTEVRGSDTHGFARVHGRFGDFTWIKMGSPDIAGLRLALIDGKPSVNWDMKAEPNQHAEYVVEEITVKKAKYIGRPEDLTCKFSPFLNTIIGGRGSGKSTLLEFMRLALRREDELPEHLKEDYQNYFHAEEDGLLIDDSTLHLTYRKGETLYRLSWAASSQGPSLSKQDEAGCWQEERGEIASLFPISIYSQKQIFALASEPQGLLGVIDRVPEVGFEKYQGELQDCVSSCKRIIHQSGQLEGRISQQDKFEGELNDVKRQIEQVEKSGHRDALQKYRLRQQHLGELQYFKQHWEALSGRLLEVLSEADVAAVNEELFDEYPEILAALQEKQSQYKGQIEQMRKIAEAQADGLKQWPSERDEQDWMKRLNMDLQQYEQLRDQLELQGVAPQAYPALLQQKSSVEKELQQMEGYRQQKKELYDRYWKNIEYAENCRKELTKSREQYLKRALADNQSVRIIIQPFAEPWADAEKEIRRILWVGDRFDKDIEALKKLVDGSEYKWKKARKYIFDIRQGNKRPQDQRFRDHLLGLPSESITDMNLWFPEDALQITFGRDNRKIEKSSPGQKSAALLAFILAHGDEPLLLDQPEDDLDNDLIYSLIVKAIKEKKTARQIIVVTHNANIVVNGDSEMVHCLEVKNGQSHLTSDSLQSEDIRQRICNTMEGGKEAFEQRYKRINLDRT